MPFRFSPRLALCFVFNILPYSPVKSFHVSTTNRYGSRNHELRLLSDEFMENDLVAIKIPPSSFESSSKYDNRPRLCVVKEGGYVYPLCQHEDDLETDLHIDPRPISLFSSSSSDDNSSSSELLFTMCEDNQQKKITDDDVVKLYGEGYYGQRVVPSLGGGPGYGAEANEIWSTDEATLEELELDMIDLPILDVGIAHGEKARGGAF